MTVRVENSTPMVVRLSWLNSLRVNRDSRLVFPTPDSPISTTGGVERQGVSWASRAPKPTELEGLLIRTGELLSENWEGAGAPGRDWGLQLPTLCIGGRRARNWIG